MRTMKEFRPISPGWEIGCFEFVKPLQNISIRIMSFESVYSRMLANRI